MEPLSVMMHFTVYACVVAEQRHSPLLPLRPRRIKHRAKHCRTVTSPNEVLRHVWTPCVLMHFTVYTFVVAEHILYVLSSTAVLL